MCSKDFRVPAEGCKNSYPITVPSDFSGEFHKNNNDSVYLLKVFRGVISETQVLLCYNGFSEFRGKDDSETYGIY